jgi:serine/threonine protein kinase/WD40 repeat protein
VARGSASELCDRLARFELLSPSQIEQTRKEIASGIGDARAMAAELVRRNWLTPFQANKLLQGKSDEVVIGPYRLLDRLGEGGMGQVFKARHARMERVVALKVVDRDRLSSATAVERFLREVKAVAQLQHPNIVLAYDCGEDRGRHYYAMEYVDGHDLAQLVKNRGPLPVREACDYVRQAAHGLQHAHERGLVHRDLKPANLMAVGGRQRAGDTKKDDSSLPIVKILDFGLARFASETRSAGNVTQLGRIVGTVDYISPEQAGDARTADIRSDIYSLGCCLFYLLTGRPPFEGADVVARIAARVLGDAPPLRRLRPDAPVELEQLVARMLERDPNRRLSTPAQIATALEGFSAAPQEIKRTQAISAVARPIPGPLTARLEPVVIAPSTATRAGQWISEDEPLIVRRSGRVRSRGWGMIAVGCASAALLAGGAIFALFNRGDDSPVDKGTSPGLAMNHPDAEDQGVPGGKLRLEPEAKGEPTTDSPLAPDSAPKVNPPPEPTNGRPDLPPGEKAVEAELVPAPALAATGQPGPAQTPSAEMTPVPVGEVSVFRGHAAPVWSVAISPNAQLALSGAANGEVVLWEIATTKALRRFEGHTDGVWSVAFSPDGTRALSGSYDKTARLWNVADGRSLQVLRTDAAVHGVAFTPDGKQALTGGADRIARLWSLRTGKQVRAFPPSQIELWGVAVSPTAGLAIARDAEPTIRLWDLSDGTTVRHFVGHAGSVLSMVFSPDGRRIASCSFDKTVRVWDVSTGKELRALEGHEDAVIGVDFSPSGQRVISCGGDKSVRLWDVTSGKELHRFDGHQDVVQRVAFSPGGRHALSASNDRTVRLWRLPAEAAVAAAKAAPPASDPRRGVPSPESIAKAEKGVRDLYKDDYAKIKHSEMSAFAERLLEQAGNITDDDVTLYVLLCEARDVAARAADAGLAFKAIDDLAARFAVDGRAMKAAALERAVREAHTPERSLLLADVARGLAEEVASADRYGDAARLAKLAESSALRSSDRALIASTMTRRKDLEFLQKAFEDLKPAAAVLVEKPDDADANLAMGRFLCLQKGDWTQGLPHLVQCSDERLKELAGKELGGIDNAQQEADLADAWREYARKERGLARNQALLHALTTLQRILPDLAGVTRIKAEKSIAQIEKDLPVEYLPEPLGARFKGHWLVPFSNRSLREYVIDTKGNAEYLRDATVANGKVIATQEVKRSAKVIKQGADYLLDFEDGTLERLSMKNGNLVVEHYDPKALYPKGRPSVVATSVRKP